jgi:hypothetical protein
MLWIGSTPAVKFLSGENYLLRLGKNKMLRAGQARASIPFLFDEISKRRRL